MKKLITRRISRAYAIAFAMTTGMLLMLLTIIARAGDRQTPGTVALKVNEMTAHQAFKSQQVYTVAGYNSSSKVSETVRNYSLLKLNNGSQQLRQSKPETVRMIIPSNKPNETFTLLLYKTDNSPAGLTVITSSGRKEAMPDFVNYRGIIEGDDFSIAAITVSGDEIMGLISNKDGNFVMGRLENDPEGTHIIYNEKDLIPVINAGCSTNTSGLPLNHSKDGGSGQMKLGSLNCVNWYWETDVDIYNGKGSVAAVTTYMNGIFNQVSALYANDGMTINFQTLFVWDTTDPYTGPSTSNYLTQFGANRTSFAGDLANLFGYQGGGGIAWIDGFCKSTSHRMAYCGISASYQSVPTYSWTVEVTAHEEGHLFGSPHTHDCSWNGNNTKIDACGDVAGYPSGSCAQTVPPTPPGGGTIMSYCHLTGAGINLSLGFGPQPTALMLDNENTSSCLGACISCPVPSQPGTITGDATTCTSSSQVYSISVVSGATSYTWSLPAGWTGSSTSNTITVTTGVSGGNLSVTANNACGSSPAKVLAVTVSSLPAQPGSITGTTAPCQSSQQTYAVSTVSGATSYTWTLPAGWSGSSSTNSIVATPGASGGTISVKANNGCGSGTVRNLTVSVNALPAVPGQISATGGNTKVCPGDVKSYHISLVSGATSYTWTPPPGATVISGQGTNNATVSYNAGFTASDSLKVSANNSCGSSAKKGIKITRNTPATPSAITGSANNVCSLPGLPYSVTAVAGMTYNWSLSTSTASVSGGQGTNAITASFGPSYTTGQVRVTASNACGVSPLRTLTVKAVPATPGSISGAATVCANQQNVPYSIAPVTGAVSYTWTGPSGARFSDGVNTSSTAVFTTPSTAVTVNYKTTAGLIKVKANNACGSGNNKNLTVTFNCREAGIQGENMLSLSPNPAHDEISISFLSSDRNYKIEIMDLIGKVVHSFERSGSEGINTEKINVSEFPKGIYMVRMTSEGENVVTRFIVE